VFSRRGALPDLLVIEKLKTAASAEKLRELAAVLGGDVST